MARGASLRAFSFREIFGMQLLLALKESCLRHESHHAIRKET